MFCQRLKLDLSEVKRGSKPRPPAMHCVFAPDVLACPRCGGRLRVIAIVQDPAVMRTLLAHDRRARAPAVPGPAPPAAPIG